MSYLKISVSRVLLGDSLQPPAAGSWFSVTVDHFTDERGPEKTADLRGSKHEASGPIGGG